MTVPIFKMFEFRAPTVLILYFQLSYVTFQSSLIILTEVYVGFKDSPKGSMQFSILKLQKQVFKMKILKKEFVVFSIKKKIVCLTDILHTMFEIYTRKT